MTLPLTTALVAAVLAVLQVVLMMTVGNKRRAESISLGDGGNQDLLRLTRRHGNLIENAPMFLILLMLLELLGGASNTVLILGGIFVLARFSHALALSSADSPLVLRVFGALGTIIGLLGSAGVLAYQVIGLM